MGKMKKLILSPFFLFCLLIGHVFAAAPTVGTITPSSGTALPGSTQIFTATYSDQDGCKTIQFAYFLLNTSTNTSNCLYAYYDQNTNKIYLRNDANTAWLGGFAPGSNNIIENSYVKINCAACSVAGSGSTLTLKWPVTFKDKFTGVKNSYLYVKDITGAYNGWVKKGTFCIFRQPINKPN